MKKYLLIGALLGLVGCASFSTNTFRTEQTAVNLAYGAYVSYTNYLFVYPGKVSIDTSNAVRQARLEFAASVGTLDNLRLAYATNSAVQPTITATISTLQDQASNIVWLVTYIQAGGK